MPRLSSDEWALIERDYRSGAYTNVALAKKYGITEGSIRQRARKEGWVREYTRQVRHSAQQKLAEHAAELQGKTRHGNRYEPQEIIESASSEITNVVLGHRKDIAKITSRVMELAEELGIMNQNVEDFEQLVEDALTAENDKQRRNKREAALRRALSLGGRTSAARDLSVALQRLIQLQRQAFNMDDDNDEEPDYEKQLKALLHAGEK